MISLISTPARAGCILTTVIDLADRKVIGWSLSTDMTAGNTSVSAIKMTLTSRGAKQDALFFIQTGGSNMHVRSSGPSLQITTLVQSMSRKANCWDNAVAESFFKSLKAEMIYHRKFMDQQSAKLEIFGYIEGYIEGFYNAKRTHSAL